MPDKYSDPGRFNTVGNRGPSSEAKGGMKYSRGLMAVWKRFTGELALEQNMALANYQYGKDLQMWELQNEYNSPAAQMERLKQAGLNPLLLYGQGVSGATGQAKEMPKYQAPRAEFHSNLMNTLQVLGQFTDLKIKNAQADLVRAQTKRTSEQAVTEVITQDLKRLQGLIAQYDVDYKKDTLQDRIKRADLLNKQTEQQWINLQKDMTIKEQMRLQQIQATIQSELSTNLRKLGINDNDPWWSRVLAQSAYNQGMNADEVAVFIKSNIDLIRKAKSFEEILRSFLPGLQYPGIPMDLFLNFKND